MKILRDLKEKIEGIKYDLSEGTVLGGPGFGQPITIKPNDVDNTLEFITETTDYNDKPLPLPEYKIFHSEKYRGTDEEVGTGWPKPILARFSGKKDGLLWKLYDNLDSFWNDQCFGYSFTRRGAEKKLSERALKTIELVSNYTGIPIIGSLE